MLLPVWQTPKSQGTGTSTNNILVKVQKLKDVSIKKSSRAYFKHHRFLFFLIYRDIGTMNPGVSAKVSKSDVRVPERKSKVSKCESVSQSRNFSIVQKCKLLPRTSEKNCHSTNCGSPKERAARTAAFGGHVNLHHLRVSDFLKSNLDEVDQTNMSCFLGGSG